VFDICRTPYNTQEVFRNTISLGVFVMVSFKSIQCQSIISSVIIDINLSWYSIIATHWIIIWEFVSGICFIFFFIARVISLSMLNVNLKTISIQIKLCVPKDLLCVVWRSTNIEHLCPVFCVQFIPHRMRTSVLRPVQVPSFYVDEILLASYLLQVIIWNWLECKEQNYVSLHLALRVSVNTILCLF
jgi:hypothetical protein